MRGVCIITDHRPLVAILCKDVATLFQQLQHIVPHIHLYRVHIIFKPGPELYISEWLSRNNHTEGKHQKLMGISINVNAISTAVDMPV